MTAILVHGFNVTDGGEATTDRLAPYLEAAGLPVLQYDQAWYRSLIANLIRVRTSDGLLARGLAEKVADGDIGVGHSNGCALLAEAARLGAPLSGLVLIDPALDRDFVVAPQVRWVHVYHNRGDNVVEAARLLFNHIWGDMGKVGYVGPDRRYTNFDCSATVSGHSDIFTKLDEWGPKIVDNALRAMA